MELTLKSANPPVQLVCEENGRELYMDGPESIGGSNDGFRPMQLLLAGLGGCSAFDAITILNKQRQKVDRYEIKVTGDRDPEAAPSPFTKLHLHYDFYGRVDEKKAEKALELAVHKYCSVGEMLKLAAPISYSFTIHS